MMCNQARDGEIAKTNFLKQIQGKGNKCGVQGLLKFQGNY